MATNDPILSQYQTGGYTASQIPSTTYLTEPATSTPTTLSSTLANTTKDQYGNFINTQTTNLNNQATTSATNTANTAATTQIQAEKDAATKLAADKLQLEKDKVGAISGTSSSPTTSTVTTIPEGSTQTSDGNFNGPNGETYTKNEYNVGTPQYYVDYTVTGGTANTTGSATGTSTGTTGTYTGSDSDYINATNASNQKLTDAYNSFKTATDQMAAGTFPLNALQKAQLDAMTKQFQDLIEKQKTANSNYEGVITRAGVASGRSRYAPEIEAGNIKAAVDQGLSKISSLQSQMSSALASMQSAFEQDNYGIMKDAYQAFTKAQADVQTNLDKMHKEVQDKIAEAQKRLDEQKQQDIVNKLNSDKFTWQQKQDIFDNAIKTGELSLARQKEAFTEAQAGGGTSGIFNNTSMPVIGSTNGIPNSQDQKAFLNSLPGGVNGKIATLVSGIASYDINPGSLTTSQKQAMGGLTQSDVLALVKQYNPGYSEAQYAANASYLKGLTNTTLTSSGGIINSGNKLINHLTEFANYVSKLPNTYPISGANKLLTSGAATLIPSIRENKASAETAAIGVKDELGKFFKGSGVADVKTIQDWEKRINTGATPSELRGTVQAALDLLQGQFLPMIDQYKQTLGKEPPVNLFIKSDTINNLTDLKNQGYRIDIPGVYYTNIDAYKRFGGGTAQELIAAHDQLLANGIDASPENALQWAQMSNQ